MTDIYWVFSILLGMLSAILVEIGVAILPPPETYHPCPRCGSTLHRFGFGYCRACSSWVSPRFLAELAVFVVGFSYLANHQTAPYFFWLGAITLVYLGLVAFIDIEVHLIQHKVALAGLLLAMLVGSQVHGYRSSFVGGGIAIVLMGLFYLLGRWYAKVKAKRMHQDPANAIDEALGFGDVSLSAILGLFLGHAHVFQRLVSGILLAGAYSLILVITMMLRKDFDPEKAIPYGPFLIFGAAIYLFPF